ncbi:hypothetical protein Mgra_00008813, partial [Meloidogyne graminicola]
GASQGLGGSGCGFFLLILINKIIIKWEGRVFNRWSSTALWALERRRFTSERQHAWSRALQAPR